MSCKQGPPRYLGDAEVYGGLALLPPSPERTAQQTESTHNKHTGSYFAVLLLFTPHWKTLKAQLPSTTVILTSPQYPRLQNREETNNVTYAKTQSTNTHQLRTSRRTFISADLAPVFIHITPAVVMHCMSQWSMLLNTMAQNSTACYILLMCDGCIHSTGLVANSRQSNGVMEYLFCLPVIPVQLKPV